MSQQQYLPHTTRQGERWDSLAAHYYDDVTKMDRLIEENPHAPITPCLPDGLKLRIPLLPKPADQQGLPPWKR